MDHHPLILLIDDSHSTIRALRDLLEQHGYLVRHAQSGRSGLDSAITHHPDLIVLDVDMPDMDGFAVCSSLKQDEQTADIPVVFISGLNDVTTKVQAFRLGGVDYITKPFHAEEVLARVQTQLQLLIDRRNLEASRQVMEEWNATLEQHVTDRTRDIMRNERRLRYLAMHDSVTRLPNRHAMHENLVRITEDPHTRAAVLYLELDGYDDISRTLGHHAADELVQQAATRLQGYVDEWRHVDVMNASLYRVGEDEFVVLLEDLEGEAAVMQSGEALLAGMQEPFTIRETMLYLPAHAGFTMYPEDSRDEEVLLQNAQMATADAKLHHELPRRIHRFHERLAQAGRERMDRILMLRSAVHNRELYLEYQPKVMLESRRLIGAEALLRWKPDGATLLPPSVFIPLAEETGIIHQLGQLVLEMVCAQIAAWQNTGYEPPPIAVNVSPLQLGEFEFEAQFLATLRDFGIHPAQIVVEITETAFLHERTHSMQVLQQLQQAGVAIHLDDFGTGYSSFSYLSDLPLDCVKIDKSFLDRCTPQLPEPPAPHRPVNHRTILEGIVTLARGLHLDIIAEGVETPEQAAMLLELGCLQAQGYYFYRPMSPEQLAPHLSTS
ncbi:putative bifunctional diguanylate cyclase/phosphodiesterase [Spirochaeta africana]|nr:EAL domain-containing response regulator [Spirochaeta africana]